jgi:phage shock protein A
MANTFGFFHQAMPEKKSLQDNYDALELRYANLARKSKIYKKQITEMQVKIEKITKERDYAVAKYISDRYKQASETQ